LFFDHPLIVFILGFLLFLVFVVACGCCRGGGFGIRDGCEGRLGLGVYGRVEGMGQRLIMLGVVHETYQDSIEHRTDGHMMTILNDAPGE
jgi:hypothetical protein